MFQRGIPRLVLPLTAMMLMAPACAIAGHVSPLRIIASSLPRVPNHQVHTSGSFPELAPSSASSPKVNPILELAVRTDEHRFAALIRSEKIDRRTAPGVYRMTTVRRLVSASSVVFSALVPTRRIVPGLNGGDSWFAMTVLTQSGRPLALDDLFTNVRQGLRVLSATVRERLITTNRCVRNSLSDAIAGPEFRRALSATLQHYRYFALLSTGLAVGFPVGQVAYPACGSVDVVIPYRSIVAVSSRFGRSVMAGTRAPD